MPSQQPLEGKKFFSKTRNKIWRENKVMWKFSVVS